MKVIYCLYDGSGIAGLPWAKAGHKVICFNSDSADHGQFFIRMDHPNIQYVDVWIDEGFEEVLALGFPKPDLIIAFPPCTDVAVSGSKHDKGEVLQDGAVQRAQQIETLGNKFNCPWVVENPVSALSTLWRKPNAYFDPYEYGRYLTGDEPSFHEQMPAFDAYEKKTCLWFGNGFKEPLKKPTFSIGYFWGWQYLGGKDEKTKVLRSLTPRGWAQAVFEANK